MKSSSEETSDVTTDYSEALKKLAKSDQLTLREELAALEHEQWMQWANSLIKSEHLSTERLNRWAECMVPYSDLSEAMKDHDREWADKVLALVETCPSSELLAAAHDVVDGYGNSYVSPSSRVGRLRSAIKAEEARGSGGIEKLRKELELATQLRSNAVAKEAATTSFGGCSTALRIVQREIAFAERRIQAAEAALATFEQAEVSELRPSSDVAGGSQEDR
jgi:uncharacterized protein YfaT (DUF1175 family)